LTGGCLIPFSTPLPLLPRFLPDSTEWTYVDPLLSVELYFTPNMNIGVEPVPADFVLLVDDVEKTALSSSYFDANQLTLTFNEAALGPTVVKLRYSAKNPDFVSAAGEVVTPFDLVITPP